MIAINLKRTISIFKSYGVIDVEYKNHPVWIEDIHEQTNTVLVKDLKTNETMEVPIDELTEG